MNKEPMKRMSFYERFVIEDPVLLSEWVDTERSPHDLTWGSKQMVTWRCSKDPRHNWKASVYSRSGGNGCPYCYGRVVLAEDSVASRNPEVLLFWDDVLDPYCLGPMSKKKVSWRCPEGHTYVVSVKQFTLAKTHGCCPYCSGRSLVPEKSLAVLRPDIAAEWLPRNTLSPSEVSLYSKEKVWFRCPIGHEFETAVERRVKTASSGCQVCAKLQESSTPQLILAEVLGKWFPDIEVEKTLRGRSRCDIYLPSVRTAIEYDGRRYHKDVERDQEKDRRIRESLGEVRIIRVREPGCPTYPTCDTETIQLEHMTDYEGLVHAVLNSLDIDDTSPLDIQVIEKVRNRSLDRYVRGSLERKFPEVAKEWHPRKNGKATAKSVKPYSSFKVWWLCKCGHQWQSTVANRSRGSACPECSRRKRLKRPIA